MPVAVIAAVAATYSQPGAYVSAHHSGIAAAVPAVPGASGAYPAPKKVAQTSATFGAGPRSPGSRRGLVTTRVAADLDLGSAGAASSGGEALTRRARPRPSRLPRP